MWSKIPNLPPNTHQMSGWEGGIIWGNYFNFRFDHLKVPPRPPNLENVLESEFDNLKVPLPPTQKHRYYNF